MNRVSLCMINIWNINTLQDAKDVIVSLKTITTEVCCMTNKFARKKRMKSLQSKLQQIKMHCVANDWHEPMQDLQVFFDKVREFNDEEERIASQLWELSRQ